MPMGWLQLLACAIAAVCAAGALGYLLRSARGSHSRSVHAAGDGDAVFWHIFLALIVLLPAVLVPVAVSRTASGALCLLAAVAGCLEASGRGSAARGGVASSP